MKRSFYIVTLLLFILSCTPKAEPELAEPAGAYQGPLFTIMKPEETGIHFQNKLVESTSMNGIVDNYYYNGAGVAVGDFNNDGLEDLYFLSTLSPNKFYLNRGKMKFEDISSVSGMEVVSGYQTGVATVDINADGWMDLYLCNSGKFNRADDGVSENPEIRKNKLYINQGSNTQGIPTFLEESEAYGLDIDLYSTQAAFLDYDRDGDLDLFLINQFPDDYDVYDIGNLISRESTLTGDRLYQNRDGKFFEVSHEAGLTNNGITCDLGIAVGDLNNDGWPDVYVSNDLPGKDELYINNQDGSFTKSIDQSIKHIPYASMGNDIADYNNDGWLDIFTLDMASEDNLSMKTSIKIMRATLYKALTGMGLHHQYMSNALQLNRGVHNPLGAPMFSDVAQLAGIPATDWSWGPLVFDMDNDGLKDLFIANGITRDLINMDYIMYKNRQFKEFMAGNINDQEYASSLLNILPHRLRSDYFYRNKGDLTFEKMNGIWVEELPTANNGSSMADLDNDGDMDVVVNNSGGPSFIYKNLASENKLGNYLQIKFSGQPNNPQGIGSRIIIRQESQEQLFEHYLTRGFQSSSSQVIHVGLGKDRIVPEVEVIWPDGKKQRLIQVESNQVLTFIYGDASEVHNYSLPLPSHFQDATESLGLNFAHRENEFDDFQREFLLPHKMSALGPALASGDVNMDGLEDFYIGGAIGQAGTLYLQKGEGFVKAPEQAWNEDRLSEDVRATFFDADGDGDPDLYVVSGGNEYAEGAKGLQDRLYENLGNGKFRRSDRALPKLTGSGSCVTPGDFDQDGDLDLFVGGRLKPGIYPTPASSHLLRNDSKQGSLQFTDITGEKAPMLKAMGMVSDATWTQVDGSGGPDLVIVGEWMGVKILLNQNQELVAPASSSGLEKEVGWWNCITAADFDKDGDMDLVAGNLGENYNFKASHTHPFEIYSGDFDNNGSYDIVLGYYNEGVLYPWHGLLRSNYQLPFIKYNFNSYEAFGKATLMDILGEQNMQNALSYKSTNFASSYFENLGNGTFKAVALPNEAQISPVNSIVTEDVDGDGHLDLILAGNLYGSEAEITRADGGIGLYLRGDGKGGFFVVPSAESGLFIDGDVKATCLIKNGPLGSRILLAAKNNDFLQAVAIKE